MSDPTSETLDSCKRELLLKELEERHRYSRFIAQAYLAWYTFFVTLNLAIMGASLGHRQEIKAYLSSMSVSFLVCNIIGFLAIFVIFRGTGNQRIRIEEIIKALGQDSPAKNVDNVFCRIYKAAGTLLRKYEPQKEIKDIKVISPYPDYLFKLLSMVFALSHLILIYFWRRFLIYGFEI